MTRHWGVQSVDGKFYGVGHYEGGKWYPGSFRKAILEWFRLREYGSYPRCKREP